MQLSSPSCLLTANILLRTAVTVMSQAGVDYVLVQAEVGTALVGVVSNAQILQLTLSEPNWPDLDLAAVISRNAAQPLEPLQSEDLNQLAIVLNQFQRTQALVLPVVDQQGQLLGVLHQTQVWQAHVDQLLATHVRQVEELQRNLQSTATSAGETTALLEAQLDHHEQQFHQYQDRLEGILNSLDDVVWSVLPGSLQLLYVNTATQKVFGRPVADFLQQLDLWLTMVHPDDRLLVEQSYAGLVHLEHSDLDYRILWPNQDVRWVRTRLYLIRDAEGQPLRINGITSDVTEQRAVREQLQYNALHDTLTGLANRSVLNDRIQQSLNRNRRHPEKFLAILFLDVDRFKVINDSLGHHIGDQLLLSLSQRLRTCQRLGDTVARLGGDEFVLLLEDLEHREDALRVAQRIHETLSTPLTIDGRELIISVSIGIAFSGGERDSATGVIDAIDPDMIDAANEVAALLRDADTAMYRAKSCGNGQHQVFDQSMHAEALHQLAIETELRRLLTVGFDSSLSATRTTPPPSPFITANESGVLQVYYQPIINLETFDVTGFEALVRWQHPQEGLIAPSEFIPIAEETGLIVQLDRWVISTAYRQLQTWQQQFPNLGNLSMSVNLSSRHFESPGLIGFFDRMITELSLDPHHFKLEITETAVVKNPRAAAQVLEQLQTRGMQICLDDFGTGYASLSYLQSLPFHILKIDRSFIHQLGGASEVTQGAGQCPRPQHDQRTITNAIINLGTNLGLGIVAEGIEAWEQVHQLQSLNCPHGQGYLFAHPMNCEDTTAFLVSSDTLGNSIRLN
jgi:diguanylate cyclase (GGDEF)-like protein